MIRRTSALVRTLAGLGACVLAARLAWEANPPADGRTLLALLLVALAAVLILPLLPRRRTR